MMDKNNQQKCHGILLDHIVRKLQKLGLKELREVYSVVCGYVDKEKTPPY